MDLQTVLTAIETWPVADRRQLIIKEIWDGLLAAPETAALTGGQVLDWQRRLDAYRDDPEAGSPWIEVMARLQRGPR